MFKKFLIAVLVMFLFVGLASAADPPNITYYSPASDPTGLNTSSQAFSIAVNQTVDIFWQINGTYVLNVSSVTGSTYTNSTAGYESNPYNVTVTVSNQGGSASHMWNWTRTIAPSLSAVSPAASSTTITTDANFSQVFNTTIDRSANVTWYINGTQVQYNSSVLVANYTNQTAGVGTYTITATTNNSNGTGNTLTWTWIVQQSSMSNAATASNLTSTGRVAMGVNSTYNFTWTDTGNITRANITFPTTFNFSALVAGNISSNLGVVTVGTKNETTGLVELYNATGINNSGMYVNFTSNVRAPPLSGNYTITLTTNKNPTGTTFGVYVRNTSRPYYVTSNNTVFTIGTESFGDGTTTIPLTGKGVANLTINAPHRTGQTNITKGYSATNATLLQVVNSSDNASVIIFVTTNGSVQDPVVVISQPRELQSSNIPAAIVALGGAGALYVLYRVRTRSR